LTNVCDLKKKGFDPVARGCARGTAGSAPRRRSPHLDTSPTGWRRRGEPRSPLVCLTVAVANRHPDSASARLERRESRRLMPPMASKWCTNARTSDSIARVSTDSRTRDPARYSRRGAKKFTDRTSPPLKRTSTWPMLVARYSRPGTVPLAQGGGTPARPEAGDQRIEPRLSAVVTSRLRAGTISTRQQVAGV